MTVRIRLDGVWEEFESVYDRKIARVECWYDPHFRHWVIYPVNADGDQLEEARYGFGKKEALEIKKDVEARIGEEC